MADDYEPSTDAVPFVIVERQPGDDSHIARWDGDPDAPGGFERLPVHHARHLASHLRSIAEAETLADGWQFWVKVAALVAVFAVPMALAVEVLAP